MQPNGRCIACKGSGIYYSEKLKLRKKCVCTLIEREILLLLLINKENLLNSGFSIKNEPAGGLTLLWYLLSNKEKPEDIDEDELFRLTEKYGDSLGYMMQKELIETTEPKPLPSLTTEPKPLPSLTRPTEPKPLTRIEQRPPLPPLPLKEVEMKIPLDTEPPRPFSKGIGAEVHRNECCLNCDRVEKEMLRLGNIFFCTECFRLIFRNSGPNLEKDIVRAWLNYNQDLLLDMRNPIKPSYSKQK